MPSRPSRPRQSTQAWNTFVRNHTPSVLASDFLVVVTATFRLLYVFVVLDVGTRPIVHWNMTARPTADWTTQQLRMIVSGDQAHRFIIHDRDAIYSEGFHRTLEAMGLTVLKTPVRVPQANAFCERVIGTIRRECLDFIIAISEGHVRARFFGSGSLTTIAADHTGVWDQAFRTNRALAGLADQGVIGSQPAIESR